ncbi:MAG: GNAT family N-acetyltransferase [Acidobacteriaceae bacterium]|nr:GNAT family N-acetyltransferase [Acidobacteriaceae bacterium]MBV9780480.1 GNAT family N-acetyltransferase [Acidobacteriaceae bacterium]
MTPNSSIEIRELTRHQEFADAVRLQREIWGFEEVDLIPLRLFVVAEKIGGQVLGAFESGKMVAFCLCIPALKSGNKSYLHSHMLGVLPEYRNTGLGRMLKLNQRKYALARGIDLIEWTFDPLEIKNAFFNIERLGAIARRYVYNQYGTTSSHLHGGLPTDRLVAEWWLRSPRAEAVCSNGRLEKPETQAVISVPNEIAQLREDDPARAREIQNAISEDFNQYFQSGLAVVGFERTDHAGKYLLGQFS